MLAAKLVEQRPSSTVEERLLIVAKAMQKIEHGILLWRMFFSTCVIAGGKINAIVHRMLENPAVHRIAVNASLGVGGKGKRKECKKSKDSETAKHQPSLLVAQGLHGIEPGGAPCRIEAG